jgi:proteasome assembly chaperone (PAC2) family protein
MSDKTTLRDPWLVAVWPGMGQVAIAAGYYLLARLEMSMLAEFSSKELFDIENVEVKGGLIVPGRMPRSRLFVWKDPQQLHDLLLFIGEAQPPLGKLAFCDRLIEYAKEHGVKRIFTFAAMATQMHPMHESRVFGVTTTREGLSELHQLELSLLEDGHIGGLNGILLGVAGDTGLEGTGLLGEIPHIFSQFSFPKASLAVLRVFTTMAGIDLDFSELSQQASMMDEQLGRLLTQLENRLAERAESEEESTFQPESPEPGAGNEEDRQRIEQLFEQAARDRSRAFELKSELDRLGIFKDYEDRFLDLFRS